MDGLDLAIRFSYIVNRLHFCGPHDAMDGFLRYATKHDNADEVRKSLMRFEGFFPYLSAIASKHGKDPFDHDVVEAYWIGNPLLDAFTKDDMRMIMSDLGRRGLPKSWVEDLSARMPDGAMPHHAFHVMYVGVGRTTGTVETTLQNMDNCRPSWGRAESVMRDSVVVDTQTLTIEKGIYSLRSDVKTAVYLPQLLTDVKIDDVVALHWGFAGMRLSKIQSQNLQKYSAAVISIVNGR
ncbi:MAG: DUF6390 family protein [Nanoarchaeota archaeon]